MRRALLFDLPVLAVLAPEGLDHVLAVLAPEGLELICKFSCTHHQETGLIHGVHLVPRTYVSTYVSERFKPFRRGCWGYLLVVCSELPMVVPVVIMLLCWWVALAL